VWLITGTDIAGNVWTGSTLTFETDVRDAGVRRVTGFFSWTGNNGAYFGRELFRGEVDTSGRLRLEGYALVPPTQGIITNVVYIVFLSASGNELINGNWGGQGIPSQSWSAVRRTQP
jgi:hypothetical protein